MYCTLRERLAKSLDYFADCSMPATPPPGLDPLASRPVASAHAQLFEQKSGHIRLLRNSLAKSRSDPVTRGVGGP